LVTKSGGNGLLATAAFLRGNLTDRQKGRFVLDHISEIAGFPASGPQNKGWIEDDARRDAFYAFPIAIRVSPRREGNIRRIDEFEMRGFLSLGATQISAENQSVARRGNSFAVFAKNVSSAQQNALHALKLFCWFSKMSNCPQIWPRRTQIGFSLPKFVLQKQIIMQRGPQTVYKRRDNSGSCRLLSSASASIRTQCIGGQGRADRAIRWLVQSGYRGV